MTAVSDLLGRKLSESGMVWSRLVNIKYALHMHEPAFVHFRFLLFTAVLWALSLALAAAPDTSCGRLPAGFGQSSWSLLSSCPPSLLLRFWETGHGDQVLPTCLGGDEGWDFWVRDDKMIKCCFVCAGRGLWSGESWAQESIVSSDEGVRSFSKGIDLRIQLCKLLSTTSFATETQWCECQ